MIEIGSGQIKTVTFSLCLFLKVPSGYSMRLCPAIYVWLYVCIFVTSKRVWFVGIVLLTPSWCRDRFWCNDSDVDGRRELFEKIFATLEAAG